MRDSTVRTITILRNIRTYLRYLRTQIRWRLVTGIAFGFLLWYTAYPTQHWNLWADKPAITLRISPQLGYAPLTIRIMVRVIQNPANRSLWLFWSDDGEFWNSSAYQLDGERAPKTHYFIRTLRLPGWWYVYSTVIRSDGTTPKTALQKVNVLEGLPRGY